jgi:hypothetical protein
MPHHLQKAAAVAAMAVAIGAPGVVGRTAATANALPISNLASECRQANGGSWVIDYNGAYQVVGYQCWNRDIDGNQYVDFYDRRGNYYGSG